MHLLALLDKALFEIIDLSHELSRTILGLLIFGFIVVFLFMKLAKLTLYQFLEGVLALLDGPFNLCHLVV